MIKEIEPDTVEKFVVSGFKEANERYCELSGGEWITTRGVESFLAYFVARPFARFFSSKKVSILLEVSKAQLEKNYLRQLRLSGGGDGRSRFDLVLLERDGLYRHAVGVIELKREDPEIYPSGYSKDIKRMAAIVGDCQNLPSFQFSCFAGFVSERKGKKRIENLRASWGRLMRDEADRNNVKVKRFDRLKTPFESDEYLYNGKPCKDSKRYGIIGCVFYR